MIKIMKRKKNELIIYSTIWGFGVLGLNMYWYL